jgi:hypothetical protein
MATRSATETAEHVLSQTKELALLAREAGLVTLAYWLEVAGFEAETQIKGKGEPTYTLD